MTEPVNWRLLLYSAVFYLALPLLLVRLFWRSLALPRYRQRWWQRLGWVPRQAQRPIWIHAVSVGEVVAISPLVNQLLAEQSTPLIITTMTPTGAAQVDQRFAGRVRHLYCPYDLPTALRRFLQRIQPRVCVIVETELWPNMINQCARRNVPVLVVNARLSARSQQGYRKLARLSAAMLSQISQLLAQHQDDARRFIELGMPATRVRVSGSIKFDIYPQPEDQAKTAQLRQQVGQRPTLLLASSHADEEAQLLAASGPLFQHYPDLLLIIVPRHPERFAAVWELCQGSGWRAQRRSDQAPVTPDTRLYLADSMGELMALYGSADLVIMGGSYVEHGGHNPLEPALLAVPVIMGPFHHNFATISHAMHQHQALLLAATMQEALARAEQLLHHPHQRQQLGQAAQRYLISQRGALAQIHQALQAYL